MQPSRDWGPALQIHRQEVRSPPHTDSQIPLAAPCSSCKYLIHFFLFYFSKILQHLYFVFALDELELELDTVLEHQVNESGSDKGIQISCRY